MCCRCMGRLETHTRIQCQTLEPQGNENPRRHPKPLPSLSRQRQASGNAYLFFKHVREANNMVICSCVLFSSTFSLALRRWLGIQLSIGFRFWLRTLIIMLHDGNTSARMNSTYQHELQLSAAEVISDAKTTNSVHHLESI